MKTILELFDEIAALAPWFIVAWVLFGFATMANAQQLTKEQDIIVQTLLGEARASVRSTPARGLFFALFRYFVLDKRPGCPAECQVFICVICKICVSQSHEQESDLLSNSCVH